MSIQASKSKDAVIFTHEAHDIEEQENSCTWSAAQWQQKLTLVRCIAYALQARLHLPASIDIEDLVQAGAEGLLNARRRYDAAQGATFDTYAAQRIRGAMLDTLRERDWLPRSVRRNMRRGEACQHRLEQRRGRAVKAWEIAQAMAMNQNDYHQVLDDVQNGQLLSYEGEGIEEEGASYSCTPDCLNASPEQLHHAETLRKMLKAAMAELPQRLRMIIEGYYFQGMTLRQLGEQLGVSESRICQLRRRTERRLYHALLANEGHDAKDDDTAVLNQDAF